MTGSPVAADRARNYAIDADRWLLEAVRDESLLERVRQHDLDEVEAGAGRISGDRHRTARGPWVRGEAFEGREEPRGDLHQRHELAICSSCSIP
ncbi:MAG: hypothetical protein JW751_02435 [Polyangiaceae bacterium]|nr:hypothetical protein [Polyangiaceae bacterium]